jgi:hypothetical protein
MSTQPGSSEWITRKPETIPPRSRFVQRSGVFKDERVVHIDPSGEPAGNPNAPPTPSNPSSLNLLPTARPAP